MRGSATLVCPECGAAKVGAAELVGDSVEVECSGCGWAGKFGELIAAGFLSDPLEVAEEVSLEYFRLLAKYASKSMGLSMIQSGIVGAKDPRQMTRLIKAACRGAHLATLEEVEKIQKELRDERRST